MRLKTEDFPIKDIPIKSIIHKDYGKTMQKKLNDKDNSSYNSRFHLDNMDELVGSIKEVGLLTPIIVTPSIEKRGGSKKTMYRLIAGNRRLNACKILDYKKIRAFVVKNNQPEQFSDEQFFTLIHITENLQRQNLTPYEFGLSLKRAYEQEDISLKTLAVKLGIRVSTIEKYLKIMDGFGTEILKHIKDETLTGKTRKEKTFFNKEKKKPLGLTDLAYISSNKSLNKKPKQLLIDVLQKNDFQRLAANKYLLVSKVAEANPKNEKEMLEVVKSVLGTSDETIYRFYVTVKNDTAKTFSGVKELREYITSNIKKLPRFPKGSIR